MTAQFGYLAVSRGELLLDHVLQMGQAFRWVLNESLGQYISTLKVGKRYCTVLLRQEEDHKVEFACLDGNCQLKELQSWLEAYFRLEVRVQELYAQDWCKTDSRFKLHEPQGVRILGQEPWETLISFICSSNNNIARITKMCHLLCSMYGTKLMEYNSIGFYSFPSSDDIANKATETELRELGFGYRAKYIVQTAQKMVQDKEAQGFQDDTEYLQEMGSKLSYEEMREYLMQFSGVGPKVADCVCLMGFQMDHVVPVDVHVNRIAKRDYHFQVTKQQIKEISTAYNNLPITRKKINLELDVIRLMLAEKWGSFAGWAQAVLFFKEIGKTSVATTKGSIEIKKHIEKEFQVKKRKVAPKVES